MDFWSIIGTIIAAAGIPSAIFGLFIGRLNKKLDRQEKRREEREQARLKNQIIQMELIAASLSLGEQLFNSFVISSAVNPTSLEDLLPKSQSADTSRTFTKDTKARIFIP